jgi:hypothetical protein
MTLSAEQLTAVKEGEAVRVREDGVECVVLRADMYDRVRSMLEGGPPTLEEQRYMLHEIGNMAGWNDPEMDVYDQP